MRIIADFRIWLQKSGRDLDPDRWAGKGDKAKKRAIALLASEAQKFAEYSKRGIVIADSTYAQRLSIIGSFYDFSNRRDLLDCVNPISKLERPHLQPYGKVEALNIDEVAAAMEVIDRSTQMGARDYTLLAVFLQTGRRLAEVGSLRWKHVRLSGRLEELGEPGDIKLTLVFERCKGGKPAQHELSAWLSAELLKSLALTYEINPIYLDGARPLWPATRGRYPGQALGGRGIARVVEKRLGTSAVHRLRHTNAAVLWQIGLKLDEIQKLLGHTHLATTARYLPAVIGHKNKKITEVDKVLFGV